MTYDHVHRGDLDVGQMLSRTFTVSFRNIISCLVMGLVLQGLPTGLFQFFVSKVSTASFAPDETLRNTYYILAGCAYLAMLVGAMLFQLGVVRVVIDDAIGKKATLVDCLQTMFRFLLPGLAISVLYSIGLVLGFAALIVPGFLFMTAFYVVIPAMVAERRGVFESFSRAAKLTSGKRWAILGTAFLMGLIVAVAGFVLGLIGGLIAAATGSTIVVAVVQGLISGATGVLSAVLVNVIYLRLVDLRGGGRVQELSDIFA